MTHHGNAHLDRDYHGALDGAHDGDVATYESIASGLLFDADPEDA